MSLVGDYDPNNIFAKIIRGEIPSVKIFEDADVMAFMDAFPQSKGHCLVISKTSSARNLLDMEPDVLVKVMSATQKLARAVTAALKPDGVVVTQFNGAPAGQSVFHVHFHIIPRSAGVDMGLHSRGMVDAKILEPIAAKIRSEL